MRAFRRAGQLKEYVSADERRMRLRQSLPRVAAQLVLLHGALWTSRSRGLLTYQRAKGPGAWVILRTPSLGARRLVSARVLLSLPVDALAWRELRTQLRPQTLTDRGEARFRYLFVPESKVVLAKRKLRAIRGLRIRPLPSG
jgi:hypothetical protein